MTTRTKPVTTCPTPFVDRTFREEHGVECKLRIWPAEGIKCAPWMLWMHGGGFIAGKYVIPNGWVIPACRTYGFHCVSVGYRLTPHVSQSQCLQDCQDGLTWCLENLNDVLKEHDASADLARYIAAGDSAGGALSTQGGCFFKPSPKVVIDVFGIVDFLEHLSRSNSTPKDAIIMPNYHKQRTDEEILAFLRDRDPSRAETMSPWDWELEPNMDLETLRRFWGVPDYVPSETDYLRMDAIKFIFGTGRSLHDFNFRRDEFESDDAYLAHAKHFSPYHQVDELGTYPPTAFLHGEEDRAVPIGQSRKFAGKLRSMGIDVVESYAPDGDHCFENDFEGPEDAGWNEYIVPVMEFVKAHVG